MGKKMGALAIAGIVLAGLGLVGFAIPVFFTTETHDIVKLGPLNVTATETSQHFVPPVLSAGLLLVGAILFAVSFFQKRA
jgi:H+/Cl- antiporter ClcA